MEVPHVIGSTQTTPEELISQTTELVSLPDIYVRIKAVIYDPNIDIRQGNQLGGLADQFLRCPEG